MLSSSGAHLGVFARLFFCFFGLYRRILESNQEAKKTTAEASTKASVLGDKNISLKGEVEKLKGLVERLTV
ncbi:hypothetical protein ACOSQ3_005041 [Xanthoceras sorbifolium]